MNTTHALIQLARSLDLLAAVAWLLVGAAGLVGLRMTWLRLTTPLPGVGRWFLPVAVPADLPTGPVPPYGPTQRRAAYPGAMTRAIGVASGLVPLLILLALAVAGRKPIRPAERIHFKHASMSFKPDVSSRYVEPPPGPSRPPLSQPFKNFLAALIRPVKDAGPDSLEILDPEEWAAGLSDGAGTGVGPTGDGPWDGESGPSGPGGDAEDGEPGPGAPAIVDELPVLVSLPAPRYPELARQAGQEGRVILRLLVGVTGRVEKVLVLESIPALNDAASEAARQARFRAATLQRRPVRVWVTLPIRFRLSDIP